LFDSRYLAKGVVMLQSLIRESFDRHTIHVLAMDENCESVLRELNIKGVIVHALKDFEALAGMHNVRATRNWTEYCWTCASVFTEFVLQICSGRVTYLDADLMFFADPELIFTEIGTKSIGITPHRFAKKDEPRLLPNGRFNVQWVTFHGEVGEACLKRWAKQCRDWCYYTNDGGKFGDQGYLDEWPTRYAGEVCEIANPGAGLAPWNVANHIVEKVGDVVMADNYTVIFYHYHELQEQESGLYRLTNWKLRDRDKELIYAPYLKALDKWKALLAATDTRKYFGPESILNAPVHLQT